MYHVLDASVDAASVSNGLVAQPLSTTNTIKMTNKSENAYKTIGEVAEILELKSKNKGVFSTHTIRFWETQFKQVKPKLLNSNSYIFLAALVSLMFESLVYRSII